MSKTKQEITDTFILEMLLIDPIEKIIVKLNNKTYRDCDVKWLNNKLDNFVEFAAQTMNINSAMKPAANKIPTIMNSYAYEYYLKYFTQLLTYFKDLLTD